MRSVQQTVTAQITFSRWRIGINSIPWIWGLALSITLTGRMIFADYNLNEDHWIVLWLGESGHFPFSKIWHALLETEVGTLGSGGRFRPIYWLHLELETWLFGDRPELYYALRILYFGLLLGVICRIAARCIGLVPALVLVTL